MPRILRSRRAGCAVAIAGLLGTALTVGAAPSFADDTHTTPPVAQSLSQVLSGTIGSSQLTDLAQAVATVAENWGSGLVDKSNAPDVVVLNRALSVPVASLAGDVSTAAPGLSLDGVLDQHAMAGANGAARAVTSTAGLTLDLGTLTGGATDSLASLKLSLGVLSSWATQDQNPDGAQAGSCTIAGLDLDLTSPALAGLVSTLSTALQPLAGLTTTLNTLITLPGVVSITGIPSVASIIATLGHVALPDGSISIDLTSGAVHVDLEKLLGSAGLNLCSTPNEKPLDLLAQALETSIPKLITDTVDDALSTATSLLHLCASSSDTGCIRITVAGVDISALGATLLNAVTTTLTTLVTTLTTSVTTVTDTLGHLLTKLSTTITDLIDLTTNLKQRDHGSFTETATELRVLKGGGHPMLELDVSRSEVGPSHAAPTPTTTPTTPVTTPAPDPTTTVYNPPLKVEAGRAPALHSSGIDVLWLSLSLLATALGLTVLLRRRRAGGHL